MSQRQIWQLIIREKVNRTILIATPSMEEADALADRIAIVSCGSVLACGSPQFLKLKFCKLACKALRSTYRLQSTIYILYIIIIIITNTIIKFLYSILQCGVGFQLGKICEGLEDIF